MHGEAMGEFQEPQAEAAGRGSKAAPLLQTQTLVRPPADPQAAFLGQFQEGSLERRVAKRVMEAVQSDVKTIGAEDKSRLSELLKTMKSQAAPETIVRNLLAARDAGETIRSLGYRPNIIADMVETDRKEATEKIQKQDTAWKEFLVSRPEATALQGKKLDDVAYLGRGMTRYALGTTINILRIEVSEALKSQNQSQAAAAMRVETSRAVGAALGAFEFMLR